MAIGVFAGAFRLYQVGARSLWLDEIGEAVTSHLPLPGLFQAVKVDAAATPLDYLGVRLMTGLFGDGTTATRLWAVIVGCLAPVVVFFLARQLFQSRRAGILAALLLAASPFAISYSQEARFYSLTVLVTAVNVLAFERAWQRGGSRDWLVYAGAASLVLYASYLAAAVLLPIEGALVLAASIDRWFIGGRQPQGVRPALIQPGLCAASLLLALGLFSPWLLYATLPELGRTYGTAQLPPLDGKLVRETFNELLGTPYQPDRAASVLATSLVAAAAVGGFVVLRLRRGAALVPVMAIAAAIPVAWLLDARENYFWATRQVAFIVPLVCVLAGGGLSAVVEVTARAAGSGRRLMLTRGALLVPALGWTVLGGGLVAHVYEAPKDDWRGVTQLISTSACPDATVHVNINDHYAYGIGYYGPQLLPRATYLTSPTGDLADIAAGSFGPRDWVVVLVYAPGVGSIDRLSTDLAAAGWTEHHFTNIRAYQRGASCVPG